MNDTASRTKKKQGLPRGWTEKQIRDLAEYYDNQSEEEQVAEHEAAYKASNQSMIAVPIDLVPEVRKLIASWRGKARPRMNKGQRQPSPLSGSRKRQRFGDQ